MKKQNNHPAYLLRTLPEDIRATKWHIMLPVPTANLADRADKLVRTLTRAVHQLHHAEKLKTAAQADAARYLFERNELLGIVQAHGLTCEIKTAQLANTAELDMRPTAIKKRAVKNAVRAGIVKPAKNAKTAVKPGRTVKSAPVKVVNNQKTAVKAVKGEK